MMMSLIFLPYCSLGKDDPLMTSLAITDVRALPGDSAFLLDDGKTAILYDTGFAFTGNAVAKNIQAVLKDRPLDYIFLTHSHYDHALGSPYIKKVYPGAKVVAGAYAATVFSKPTARNTMRELDRKAAAARGITAYEDRIDELCVDIAVSDGDTLICGDLTFSVVALPGHTKCSVGYWLPEQKLLLSTETLGVYFGEGICLPSCLVGYQLALDSFRKAAQLDIKQLLLPHYGLLKDRSAPAYLEIAKRATRQTAEDIRRRLLSGRSREEIIAGLEAETYTDTVALTYPIDAFRLNTGIMIDLIRREFSVSAPEI